MIFNLWAYFRAHFYTMMKSLLHPIHMTQAPNSSLKSNFLEIIQILN